MGRRAQVVNFRAAASALGWALFTAHAHAAPEPPSGTPPPATSLAPPPTSLAPVPGKRESFVVRRFVTEHPQKTLEHLSTGLAAIVAERMAGHPALRFVGGPNLVSPEARVDDDVLVVTGTFDRRPDWKIEVGVAVTRAGQRLAEATLTATRDDVAGTAVRAALAALERAGRPLPAARVASLTAVFGRDPYAFVLYGRGLAEWLAGGKGAEERTIALLQRSLVIDPRVPETRRLLGHVHAVAGRPGHARTMWLYALDIRPDYPLALSALAALDRAGKLPTALGRFEKVLDGDPDDLDARRAYGELLGEAGQLDRAQQELERVLLANPADLKARRSLTLVLASRHAGKELARELGEIVRQDPDDLDARFELGAALVAVGKLDDAAAVYDDILKRRPRHLLALKLAGDVNRERGDLARASTLYEKLRRLSPQDPRPVFLLGTAYFQAGRLDAAERVFLEATRYPGMLSDAWGNLGAIAVRRGNFREAIWFLQRAAERRPGRPSIRYNHALALMGLDRPEDALREMQAAVSAEPMDAGLRHGLGVILLRLDRLADAESAFREAVRLDPSFPDARHNLDLLESVSHPKTERP